VAKALARVGAAVNDHPLVASSNRMPGSDEVTDQSVLTDSLINHTAREGSGARVLDSRSRWP